MVREVIPPGWEQTFPGGADQGFEVTVGSGGLNVAFDFGNVRADDYGDAPESYGTAAADQGPSHPILSGLYLGAGVDADSDGVPSVGADSDDLNRLVDDEDGIRFTGVVFPGSTSTVQVTVETGGNSSGLLNAWIDFNRNGVFDSSEKIFSNRLLAEDVHELTFNVPTTAIPGLSYARFRYGYTRGQGPLGPDTAGEVEDYQVRILGNTPDAVEDQFTVPQNSTSNRLNVLANDIPSRNGPIFDRLDHDPQSGRTCLDHHRRQRVELHARRGFFGAETFFYTIIDRQGVTDTASVTVTVLPVFVNPIAVDDSFDVQENSTENVLNVLANDFSGKSPPIAIVDVLSRAGIAEIDDRGTTDPRDDVVLYTPDAGWDDRPVPVHRRRRERSPRHGDSHHPH